jgi:uncharacterized membrane protein
MGDFKGTVTVDASAQKLFDYLSDIGNLPRYFDRMSTAEPGDGDEVHTTATTPDGRRVEGEATFKADRETQHLEWGSEGENAYGGFLDIRGEGDSCVVEVHLHSTRVGDGNAEIQHGIEQTLDQIKRLVEEQGVGR